jgi:two-component system, chemotaxis family, sensor kinase CheA
VSLPESLPEQLVSRFRAVTAERLARIEDAWISLTQRASGTQVEPELLHDIHTLKGDARVVGFADVALLAQRLEDLIFAARRTRYRVHDDADVVVTMALQFIGLLIRKKAGASAGGIDLAGFLDHGDEVLRDWPRSSDFVPTRGSVPASRVEALRAAPDARQRLASVATVIFLESLRAPLGSSSRQRLRSAFDDLSGELAELEAVPIVGLLKRHASTGLELATELGKEVDVIVEPTDARVGLEATDTLNAALVHLIRNAVDHGIETAEERRALGKSPRGTIRISCDASGERLELRVADDGSGVDLDKIRRRAAELGIEPAGPDDAALLELVFRPGFSSRAAVGPLSGRGIGMDAVRSALGKLRGTVAIESTAGVGLTSVVRLPRGASILDVHRIPASVTGVALAVPSTWRQRVVTDGTGVDLARMLELSGTTTEPPVLVTITREREEYTLVTGGAPREATATRICPLPAGEPLEIVQIEDELAILFRPELALLPPRR